MEQTCKFRVNKGNMGKLITFSIILYPILTMFQGLDLADTGYLMNQYAAFYDNPSSIDFSIYLTILLGASWVKIFNSLGLIGIYLLNAILEILTAFLWYKAFEKHLSKNILLLGILISMIICNGFFNVLHYNSLSMAVFSAALLSLEKGLIENNNKWLFIAGLFIGINIFVRIPNIIGVLFIYVVIYWGIVNHWKGKQYFNKILICIVGFVLAVTAMILILYFSDHLKYFIDSIFRTRELASSGNGGYSMAMMMIKLVSENYIIVQYGCVLSFIALVITMISIIREKNQYKKNVVVNLILLISYILFVIILFKDLIIHFENIFSSRVIIFPFVGIIYFFNILYILYSLINEINKELTLLSIIGIGLSVFICIGSNTGAFYNILGLWPNIIIFFYIINSILNRKSKYMKVIKRSTIIIVILIFINLVGLATSRMLYDENNRFKLTHKIESNKLMGIVTTERKANSVNGVIDYCKNNLRDKENLIVYGHTPMLYWILDKNQYVDSSWISLSSYCVDRFKENIKKSYDEKENPIIIITKTNGCEDFNEKCYPERVENFDEIKSKDEKFKVLNGFMEKENYNKVYENEYFEIYSY